MITRGVGPLRLSRPGRLQALLDLCADCPLSDAIDEVFGHLEVDISFQQGHAHFAQCCVDIILGQPAFAAKLLKDGLQAITQALEHSTGLYHPLSHRQEL